MIFLVLGLAYLVFAVVAWNEYAQIQKDIDRHFEPRTEEDKGN